MIKGVIFDFDGTLTNRLKSAHKTYSDFFKLSFPDKKAIEIESMTQNMMFYECNGTRGTLKAGLLFAQEYGLDNEFAEKLNKYYGEHVVENQIIRKETISVLKKLKNDYKMGILTNGASNIQNGKIDFLGIREYFDVILPTGEIGFHKPDPRAFEAIIDRLGLEKKDCVYIGDVFSGDIYGSTSAGIRPIWYLADPSKPYNYDGLIIHNLEELPELLKSL